MFRLAALDIHSVRPSRAGPSIIGCEIPVVFGRFSLQRQRRFKNESLVPVFPTTTVLLSVPLLSASDPTAAVRNALPALNDFLRALAPPHPLQGVAAYHSGDDGSSALFLCFEFDDVDVALDTVYAVNSSPIPFNADETGNRRVIAFPATASPQLFSAAQSTPAAKSTPPKATSQGLGVPEPVVAGEYFDLPMCMMCLDRIDRKITGLDRGVCSCTDGGSCSCFLQASCSVCRTLVLPGTMPPCHGCGAADETWLCLICGFGGCSRYRQEHAKEHFSRTRHEFAVSVRTQQIWDYVDDAYAQRLITCLEEGSGGAGPGGPTSSSSTAGASHARSEKVAAGLVSRMNVESSHYHGDGILRPIKTIVDPKLDVKVENICQDYSRLLVNQLAQQRAHYDSLLQPLVPSPAIGGTSSSEPPPISWPIYDASQAYAAFETFSRPHSTVQVVGLEQRYSKRHSLRFSELLSAQREEAALMRDQDEWKGKVRSQLEQSVAKTVELKNRIRELEESIAEAKANLNTMHKLQETGAGGTVAHIEGTGRRGGGPQRSRRR